jgi:hypothetical protein
VEGEIRNAWISTAATVGEVSQRKREYSQYLASETWRTTRNAVVDANDGRCQFCGSLVEAVHHVRYPKRFGDESPTDLVAVCGRCHELSHGRRLMDEMKAAQKFRVIAPSGKPFSHLVCGEAKVWSTIEHWCIALQIPSYLHTKFRVQVETAARDEGHAGNQAESRYEGQTVYRWHAVSRAMETFEHAYYAEQYREVANRRWTDDERSDGGRSQELSQADALGQRSAGAGDCITLETGDRKQRRRRAGNHAANAYRGDPRSGRAAAARP